jgi:uncharacterized membrane protein
MKSFNKIFLRGLVTVLPIALTFYILYHVVHILDNVLGSLLKIFIEDRTYIPGLGLLLAFVLIFLFGLLLNNLIVSNFLKLFENRFKEVPFIKAIYSPLRDLMNLFSKKEHGSLQSVVLVKMGDSDACALGVVTRESFEDLPFDGLAKDKVAVYFPLSYGLGGFTFLIPKDKIQKIDLPIEKAMSLAITGWVKSDESSQKHD